MIRLLFCLHRLPHLTRAEFQDYWRDKHAPLVREYAPVTRLRRYIQHHTFEDPRFLAVASARHAPEAYDGVAELCWDSLDDIAATTSDPAARAAGKALLADERQFIDLPRSPIFFANGNTVIPG